jgi:hypothetical protein
LFLKNTFQKAEVQKKAAISEAALMSKTLQISFRNGRLCFGPPQSMGGGMAAAEFKKQQSFKK